MRGFRSLLLFLLIYLPTALWCQWATVRGTVTDEDGLAISMVRVQVKGAKDFSVSDSLGRFTHTIPADRDVVLEFKYFDLSKEQPVHANSGEVVLLKVKLVSGSEKGVVIYGTTERKPGIAPIETRLKASLPSISGGIEGYLIQAPVNFASELSSSYSVRGGSYDENLVYVNDIQVYRPFLVRAGEQEGLSFPNPDMVQSINFSAGGFEARYGDKMSSVLDIRYRRPDSLSGNVMASLLGGTAHLEGISADKRWTHNTGVRYKRNTYVLNSLDTRGDYDPRYTDLQSFITFSPKPYGPVDFSFLGNYSSNKYRFIPQTRQTDVGNINEALRLTVFFEGQEVTQFETFFGAFTTSWRPDTRHYPLQLKLIASAFQTYETEHFDVLGAYRLDELERDLGSETFGEVLKNRGVGAFLNHGRNSLQARVLSLQHRGLLDVDAHHRVLEWGVDLQQESITDHLQEWTLIDSAGYASPRPQDSIPFNGGPYNPNPNQLIYLHDNFRADNEVNSVRASAFVQQRWQWKNEHNHKWLATAGVRSNYWTFNSQVVVSPRMQFSLVPDWTVNKRSRYTQRDTTIQRDVVFSLATGYYYQPPFYREMRDFSGRVNPDIRAQQSIHFIAGADYLLYLWKRPFQLRSEIYYKLMDKLIPYELQNVRQRYFATNNSHGYAAGADVMMNGEFLPGVQSWLRASVLKTMEDLRDDFYYIYLNSDGDTIYPGFTLNNVAVDSLRQTPGYIPRPSDQRFSFSMLFQDEMPRWPQYKVILTLYYSTGLPYGPPSRERYLDVYRTSSYLRTDIGFARDLITATNRHKNKFTRTFSEGTISLEVFNLLGVNNTINHQWIEDVDGRLYGIPTYLTGRRLNARLALRF